MPLQYSNAPTLKLKNISRKEWIKWLLLWKNSKKHWISAAQRNLVCSVRPTKQHASKSTTRKISRNDSKAQVLIQLFLWSSLWHNWTIATLWHWRSSRVTKVAGWAFACWISLRTSILRAAMVSVRVVGRLTRWVRVIHLHLVGVITTATSIRSQKW